VTGNNYNVSNPSFCLEPSPATQFLGWKWRMRGPSKKAGFWRKHYIMAVTFTKSYFFLACRYKTHCLRLCTVNTKSKLVVAYEVYILNRPVFLYYIQHCFICRPSDSTVSKDAGIEPRTVAPGALAVRRSNH
jgi:hypothetical protein